LATRLSLKSLQGTGMGFFRLYGSTAALATTLTLAIAISCIGVGFQRGTHTRWQLVANDGTGAPTLADNRTPWRDVSRIDDEMRALMRDVVNRLYTFQLHAGNPALQAEIAKCMSVAGKWDEPRIDARMMGSDRTAE